MTEKTRQMYQCLYTSSVYKGVTHTTSASLPIVYLYARRLSIEKVKSALVHSALQGDKHFYSVSLLSGYNEGHGTVHRNALFLIFTCVFANTRKKTSQY